MLPNTGKKKLMCDILKFVPGVCSPLSHFILRQLHLNIYVLLADVGPCSPSSASSDTSTPELSGLPSHLASWNLDITSPQFRPPSFQGKAFFRQVLAKLSPNFYKKSPFFAKKTHLPIDYRFTKCPRP